MEPRIYFAASIRGGREDAGIYAAIIELLMPYGMVLSEHVGDQTLTAEEGSGSDTLSIYMKDLGYLERSHLLVAETTVPSTGLGYEICYAQHVREIPVVCLYRPAPKRSQSAMVTGNPHIRAVQYREVTELAHVFSAILPPYLQSITA
jgi:hypothetical protein